LTNVLIEVDGGVKLHNASEVINSGANILVAGSEVFKSEDPVQTIREFYKLAD
jgi:ribulose-phosphate 3-epimerase